LKAKTDEEFAQLTESERLVQNCIKTGEIVNSRRRNEHKGQVGQLPSNRFGDLGAVEFGHSKVNERKVECPTLRGLTDGISSTSCLQHSAPQRGEHLAENPANEDIVVNEQNQGRGQ
jgi:hypothetical protein